MKTGGNVMVTKIIDNAYTSVGGACGSLLGYVTFENIQDAVILAVVGAFVGYMIKLGLDYCKCKIHECRKKNKQ